MDIETARAHEGDRVLYRTPGSEPETGYLMHAGDPYCAVLYDHDYATKATRPEDLTLLTGRCPDGGSCHHLCPSVGECFRVDCCGPLSGVYPGDRWPADVLAAHVRTGGDDDA